MQEEASAPRRPQRLPRVFGAAPGQKGFEVRQLVPLAEGEDTTGRAVLLPNLFDVDRCLAQSLVLLRLELLAATQLRAWRSFPCWLPGIPVGCSRFATRSSCGAGKGAAKSATVFVQ